MSAYDIDSSIRIVVSAGALSKESRDRLIESRASPSKDLRTWTIDVASEPGASGVENTLTHCLELISKLKAGPWWLPDWSITIWVTISSAGEFAGLALPSGVSKRAGEMEVDVIFSVYCRQDDVSG